MERLTYDVRVWDIRKYRGRKRTSYTVRWATAGRERQRTFQTRKLAESFRSSLVRATTRGEAFDTKSGLPESVARQQSSITWYEHAQEFVDMKWPRASARYRRSIAEALATVTPALLLDGRGGPTAREIRRVAG